MQVLHFLSGAANTALGAFCPTRSSLRAACGENKQLSAASLKAEEGVLAGRSVRLAASCSPEEKMSADQVKSIHDRVEEIAYRALAEAIKVLGIKTDAITFEQSSQILLAIKTEAHRELFKKDGYMSMRGVLLQRSQIEKVIANVGKIIHDRDSKLTDARYSRLSELLMGLDDHNTMVKEILLSSWFKDESFSDPDHVHLKEIKANVRFYESLAAHLDFDLEKALRERQAFWDKYFPGLRVGGEASSDFVQILEVRNALGCVHNPAMNTIILGGSIVVGADRFEAPLISLLPRESHSLFEQRREYNAIRRGYVEVPALLDPSITLREALRLYFPEIGL